MKRFTTLSVLFWLFVSAATSLTAQNGVSNGYWVTPNFLSVQTAHGIDKQKMLLCVQPMPGGNGLYRVYYYLWNKDYVNIQGPVFENGVLDKDTGWLYLSKGGNGRDILKFENGNLFYFMNSKANGATKSTIFNMMKVDDQNGLQLEMIVRKKLKEK